MVIKPYPEVVDSIDSFLASKADWLFRLITSPQTKLDNVIFGPIARRIPHSMQELADSAISITGDFAVALTAPEGRAKKAKQWLPYIRVPELISGFVATNRDYFRMAYFAVVAKHQGAIEAYHGLKAGSLDKIAANGARVEGYVKQMAEKGLTGAIISRTISYLSSVYGDGARRSCLDLDLTETYILTRFLVENGMSEEAEKILPDDEYERGLQTFVSGCYDKTMLIKGAALMTSGFFSTKGATTPPETVKGIALMLGGLEISTILPGGRRYQNPLHLNPSMSKRGFLAHLINPSSWLAEAVEHAQTQKEVPKAFKLLGTANLFDASYNTAMALTQDSSRGWESFGKWNMYLLYAVAARLRAQMGERAGNWRDFMAGKDVAPASLGL